MLKEAAKGIPTAHIAADYGLSVYTVRTHFKNILRKLGAHTRAQAVAIAYSEGLFDRDPKPSAHRPMRRRPARRTAAREGRASNLQPSSM